MPADFSLPVNTTTYTSVLSDLKERDTDAITLCYAGDPSNIPTGAKKYNTGSDKFQEWNGSAWVDKVISIAGGGSGAASASAARTAFGLGTLAVQDSSAISLTGGTITSGVAIAAGAIQSGLIAQARLGTGSAGAGALFLADDQTFKAATTVLTGSGLIWFTNSPPSGYLICDGSAVSRTTYSVLFGIIGTTYGVGDGSTTFNLPDLRQRFPLGKAASGTGSTIAGTGGAIDHTHTSAAHTHTSAAHTHTMGNHTHSSGSFTQPSHTHNIDVGTASALAGGVVEVVTGSGTVVVSSGSGGSHSHNFAGANSGSGGADAITGTSGTPSTNTSDSTTPSDTGSTTPGATGANNAPYLVINYVIKF